MGFDFATWPPELIAALIKAGAGSAPMMSAATSWQGLAAELEQAATAYQSVISELGSTWHGPSSTSMASAAGEYIEWLQQTAAESQQAGTQAMSSAAAYETASNAIVPVPVIEANRAQLQTLVATNFLGVNTPAILATEAAYAAMWATNSAVMYAYSAASSAASELTPMTPAPQNTNPAASVAQATAAPASAANSSAQSGLNGIGTLSQLSSASTAAADPTGLFSSIDTFLGYPVVSAAINNSVYTAAWWIPMMAGTIPMLMHTLGGAGFVPPLLASDTATLGAGLLAGGVSPASGVGSLGGTGVLASMGGSSAVGGMAVPAGWAGAAPEISGDATLAGTGWTAAAEEPAAMGGGAPGVMPGIASAGGKAGTGFGGPRYGIKPTVMPKQVFV